MSHADKLREMLMRIAAVAVACTWIVAGPLVAAPILFTLLALWLLWR